MSQDSADEYSSIIAYLLKRGANPKLRNNDGKCPSDIVNPNKNQNSENIGNVKDLLVNAENNYETNRNEKFIELMNELESNSGKLSTLGLKVYIEDYLMNEGDVNYINLRGESLFHASCLMYAS